MPTTLRRAASFAILAAAAAFAFLAPPPLHGQEERFPGVELGFVYESYTPALGVHGFEARLGAATVAPLVEAIIAQDLRYSERFRMLDSVPAALMNRAVDYTLWDRLGATWLLSGVVEGAGDGYVLVMQFHDIPYNRIVESGRFDIPDPDHPDFRMAVHRASDRVVEWAFGEPGMAASRIAFAMRRGEGPKELWVIDSDGENLTRLTSHDDIVLSPTWAPDGSKIAYTSWFDTGFMDLFEIDLATRQWSKVDIKRTGDIQSPSYSPNGDRLIFTVRGGTRSGMYTYNVERDCCLTNITEGARIDTNPVFSPDGGRVAFMSNRLGSNIPQVYLMPAEGGDAELVSPYVYGQEGYYTSPDWSPKGDHIAFHGRIGRYGRYQILVARVGEEGRLVQLTSDGNNEDPSWAPDNRHLVFAGERDWGKGLWVVNAATGRVRLLLGGVEVSTPDWSHALAPRRGN